MNKCFITKLPSSIDNDNLPVLGQLRINWLKQSDLTNNKARAFDVATNDSITVKVSGAHFTDETLTSNLGNTKTITASDGEVWLYVSNDADAVLTIDNKYSLTVLNFLATGTDNIKRLVYFDIEDIKYCTNLTKLYASNSQVSGDISALSGLTNLSYLNLSISKVNGNISALSELTKLVMIGLSNTQVSGDISALSKLTNCGAMVLESTQVSGNISAVSNLTNLYALNLNNTQVSGDINAVSNLTNLITLNLNNIQVSGKVDSLANLTKLSNLTQLKGLSLTGDMSKIPAGVNFISQNYRKVTTNFTWTANGRKNATLLAMEGRVPFDTASMDNMFIDQATCTFKPTDSFSRIIAVSGTRTSASDEAVAAIQNMGVTITGVTKQA